MLHNTSRKANSITLMWDSPQDAGIAFEVYSDPASDGAFTKLVYAGNENFCEIKQLTTGEQRYYRMRWTIGGVPSEWSNVCAATPSAAQIPSVFFASVGDGVAMAFVGSATATYHWSDSTTSSSGSKSGLGTGIHVHYVTFDTPANVTEFGNPSTTVYAIDGLNYLTSINTIMVYDNIYCRRFGHTDLCLNLRNYHIASSGLTDAHMDMQYVDMIAIGQTPGDWYAPSATGTIESYTERMALRAAGWNDIPSSPAPAAVQNVVYNGNGSDGGSVPVDSSDYAYRDTVTVPGNSGALTFAGRSFIGWNTRADGTGMFYSAGDSFSIMQDTTLYAVWEVSGAVTHTVTFNANGGTGSMTDQTIQEGSSANLSANTFTRNGHSFEGWALTSGGSVDYADEAPYTMGTGDVTLYAVWAVVPPATTLTFTTSGDSFAPRIEVTGTPEILWTFSDSTTSDSITPSVSFGSAGTREHTLTVTPWSALVGINLGYTADDGGSEDIPLQPAQSVTALDGLEYVQETLQYICGSGTPLIALDLSGFTALHTIEFFQGSLTAVDVSGCISLRRVCLEACSIPTLDLTGLSTLEDLRYADNGSTGLTLPATANNLWHICIRDNPLIGITPTFNYPALRDLYVWNCGLAGACTVQATAIHQILIYDNPLTSLDLSACGFMADLDLWAQGGGLSQASVDAALLAIDTGGVTSGTVNLSGGTNSAPSTDTAVNSLRAKGLSVTVNTIPTHSVTFSAAGGSGTMAALTLAEGASTNLPANAFTRDGHSFEGWALSQGGAVAYTDQAALTMGAGDIALFAVWEAIPVAVYQVSYTAPDATTGTLPATESHEDGSTVTPAGNPGGLSRPGHTFAGWALAPGGAAVTSFQVTADVTLYAVWEEVPSVFFLRDVTRNSLGNPVGGVQVSLFKHIGTGVYDYVGTTVSDIETGEFEFSVFDDDPAYMIYGRREGTPNTFDATDSNLQPVP